MRYAYPDPGVQYYVWRDDGGGMFMLNPNATTPDHRDCLRRTFTKVAEFYAASYERALEEFNRIKNRIDPRHG